MHERHFNYITAGSNYAIETVSRPLSCLGYMFNPLKMPAENGWEDSLNRIGNGLAVIPNIAISAVTTSAEFAIQKTLDSLL